MGTVTPDPAEELQAARGSRGVDYKITRRAVGDDRDRVAYGKGAHGARVVANARKLFADGTLLSLTVERRISYVGPWGVVPDDEHIG